MSINKTIGQTENVGVHVICATMYILGAPKIREFLVSEDNFPCCVFKDFCRVFLLCDATDLLWILIKHYDWRGLVFQ